MLYGFTYVLEITDLLQEWETYFHVTIYFKIHSLKFTKTSFFICLHSSQYYVSTKTFHVVSFSCTWFSINKDLFEQNLLC